MSMLSIYHIPKRHKRKTKFSSKEARKRNKMPYNAFLKTEYWKKVRKDAIARDKKCKKCGTTENLQVHHLSYKYRGDELEHMCTVVTLCKSCHGVEHFGKPEPKVKLRRRNEYL